MTRIADLVRPTLAGVTLILGGCAGGGGGASQRPLLDNSAAEAAMASAAGNRAELEFFDALESRRLISHDDLLNVALLVGNGRTESTPRERVELARQLGYVSADFNRPPREAATVGEVARLALRITDGAPAAGLNQEQAIGRLAGRAALPPTVRPYQGLTGAQLLTVFQGVRSEIASRSRERIALQAMPASPIPVVPASPSAASTGSAAVASADDDASGNPRSGSEGEPLPESARDPVLERPAHAAPAAPAAEWVPGQPLKRPK